MKVCYYYLYFRLYKFAKKVGTVDATWTAMLVISALIYLNIASIFLFLFKQGVFFVNPRILGGSVGIFISFINYLIFIRHDNCLKIIHQFKGENKKQINISTTLTLVYVLLTLFLSHFFI